MTAGGVGSEGGRDGRSGSDRGSAASGSDRGSASRGGSRDSTEPYCIGHRGCLVGEPENTIRSALAAAPHVDAVEIDVRRCGSGDIVVVHDPTLERVCDADVRVDRCTVDELRGYGVDGTDEPIPTLRELLAALPVDVDVNVELKTTGLAADVAEALSAVDNEAFVSSFSARALAELRDVAPGIRRGLLYKRSWERALVAADRLDCELLHPYVEAVDRTHLRAAAEAGFTVNAWGVSDSETYHRMVDRGVDGVIVDDYQCLVDDDADL
ncbi:glycerophosphodiester phosphodiesterase family protein [Halorubrum luteum]